MIGHIDAIRMHNIQSWGEEGNVLEFEYTKVNVIIARNETGKSVMMKVFRQMCFPSFFGRSGRKDLIKRNCEFGQMDILTVDGHYITFVMFDTAQKYILKYPDGQVQEWVQNELPEPIRLILGWYIDVEHQILLNIIDHEISMPLVETEKSFNAKVLRFVVEHQQLEENVVQLKSWSEELKELIEAENRTVDNLTSKIDMIPKKDLSELHDKLEITRLYDKVFKSIQYVSTAVNDYNIQVPNIETKELLSKEDSVELETIMEQIKVIDTLTENFNNHQTLTEPQFKEIDEKTYNQLKETDIELHGLLLSVAELYNHNLNKPTVPTIDEKIHDVMKTRQSLFILDKSLDNLLSNVNRQKFLAIELVNINRNIEHLENELGVCPLCSRPFDNKGEHVHE